MRLEEAPNHLQEAVRHLREAAACCHRDYPELTALFWQVAESLSDCDPEHPMLTLDLPDSFILEVGCTMRQTFEGPLWLTIVVPPRDN